MARLVQADDQCIDTAREAMARQGCNHGRLTRTGIEAPFSEHQFVRSPPDASDLP
jgi:hypothetical protein